MIDISVAEPTRDQHKSPIRIQNDQKRPYHETSSQ